MLIVIRIAFVFLLLMSLPAGGFPAEKPGPFPGATKEETRPAKPEKAPEDPLGRGTPQGTVFGFIKSATQEDYDRAIRYLDTNKRGPAAQKIIYALHVILERGFSGSLPILNSRPEGDLEDNLPPTRERIGTVQTQSGSWDIFLDRVRRGDNPPIWVFSAQTLAKVPEIYQALDVRTIDEYLPKFLVNTWLLWFPLWRWLVILLVIPLAFVLATLLTRLLTALLVRYSRPIISGAGDRPVVRLGGPIRILIFATAIWIISLLSQSILAGNFWAYVAQTLTVLGLTWLCLGFTDILFELRERRLGGAPSGKVSLLQLGKKLIKVLAVMIGALFIFYIAGINLTAVFAGLGIGGIAVALAAQKTLENLIGGITIVSDQPIRVGDFCRVGEYLGTVQAVGLRSTRIRTLARTLVSIPNGQLALMNLENYTLRDKIWFNHTLSLRYETTPEQLRYILAEIHRMLQGHPQVESVSARVRFIGFGGSSLNVEVFAYVLETGYDAFLHIQEDLLLGIMDIVAASGSALAFPSRTTYLAQDGGLDAGKTQEAISKVSEWRQKGEWPFPEIPSSKKGD